MTAPKCRMCGKTIAKQIESLHLRSEAQKQRGVGGSDWLTVPELPKTKEEAQRYVNWKITRVTVWPGDQQDEISVIYGWDGESYSPRYGYFCTVTCAAKYGRWAAGASQ